MNAHDRQQLRQQIDQAKRAEIDRAHGRNVRLCWGCGTQLPGDRRRYCTTACQTRAWKRRRAEEEAASIDHEPERKQVAPARPVVVAAPPRSPKSKRGRKRQWTEKRVVDAIKMWARENGRFPSSTEFQRPNAGYPTYATVRNFFVSWMDALAAAGCPTNVPSGLVHVSADGSVVVIENMAVTPVPPELPIIAPPDEAPQPPQPPPEPEPEPAPPITRANIEAFLRELDPECEIDAPALVIAAAFMGCRRTTLALTAKTGARYADVAECVERMRSCGLWRNEFMCFESDPDDDAAVIEFWLHVLVAGGELDYLPGEAA